MTLPFWIARRTCAGAAAAHSPLAWSGGRTLRPSTGKYNGQLREQTRTRRDPGGTLLAVVAKKTTSTIPAAKLELYERLIATDPTIERKGVTLPYTSISGRMFTFLSPTGDLRPRLPDAERDAFLKKYRTTLAVSSGVVMKDFVAVPPRLLARTAELKPYLGISRAYAERLGTKGSAKRAATGATKGARAVR